MVMYKHHHVIYPSQEIYAIGVEMQKAYEHKERLSYLKSNLTVKNNISTGNSDIYLSYDVITVEVPVAIHSVQLRKIKQKKLLICVYHYLSE